MSLTLFNENVNETHDRILRKELKVQYLLLIFLLDINFENLTIELHILIISSMYSKFQEGKKKLYH